MKISVEYRRFSILWPLAVVAALVVTQKRRNGSGIPEQLSIIKGE